MPSRATWMFAAVFFSCTLCALPARAEIGASGTRLAIGGGAPQFYMTYGHMEESELYAPIVPELRRLRITFQQRGEDYLVFQNGVQVAEWPVVHSRGEVPETGENALVLVLGGRVFVPVRKLAELLSLNVRWDRANNIVSLPAPAARVPGARLQPPAARAPGPERQAGAPAVSLTGIALEQQGTAVQIHVQTTAVVRPTWLNLKNPARIVLDFPNARWAEGVQAPAGAGAVRQVRLGQFTPTIARVVLELPSPKVKVTDLQVLPQEIQASIGQGREARPVLIAPAREAKIRQIIRRRASGRVSMSQRGGPLDGSLLQPGEPSPNPEEPRRLPVDPLNPRGLPNPIEPGSQAGALVGKVICVDAGHGGHSAGARGLQHLEKDLCLQMCLALRRSLQAHGATVIMSRETDVYVSLEERWDFANRHNADIFISIHCNSMPRRNTQSGSETYWHTLQSFRLAQALHPRLVAAVRERDGGIRSRSFAVIRETRMPSVLLEIAYINNTEDEHLLARPDFHTLLGEQLAQGVVSYFQEQAQE